MTRSIPFARLRGYGSQPNVSGARAKVDTRNRRYEVIAFVGKYVCARVV